MLTSLISLLKSSPKQALKEWNAQVQEWNKFSPDIWQLSRRPYHLIFICDELMRSRPRHQLLEENGAQYRNTVFTKNNFTFWKINRGSILTPIPLLTPDLISTPSLKIKGELFVIPLPMLLLLDRERQNGVVFDRTRVKLDIPHRKLMFNKEPVKIFRGVREDDWRELYDNQIYTLSNETYNMEVEAWMYVGKPEYWNHQLDGGYNFQPIRRFQPNDPHVKPYYFYSPLEYAV